MLTGRESLLRVIGKRRRFLPNRRSIISAAAAAASSSTVQSCLSFCEREEIKQRESVEQTSNGADSVNCPVCGDRFPGLDNALINSHLDGCLAKGNKEKVSQCLMVSDDTPAKGTKRKLNQVTLLQLNFSRSKVKLQFSQSTYYPVIPSEPDRTSTCDTIDNLNELDRSVECADPSLPVGNGLFTSHVENLISKKTADYKIASPESPSCIERPKYVLEELLDDCDVSGVIIPTFIVGRRFGGREELDPESRICFSRDPENVKDPNAIKVLYADYGCDNMLGYIPRELAQYLSPLIDKFGLNFEL